MEGLWLKQCTFAENISKLIRYIRDRGYYARYEEFYRTPEQAKINAAKGTGIENSLHCERLAGDLTLFDRTGKPFTKTEDYEWVGDYWKSLHPLNRWGGEFNDGNHFSMKIDANDPRR